MRNTILLLAVALPALVAEDGVLARVAAHADHFGAVSRQIWEWPELSFHEKKSSTLLSDDLGKAGFMVQEGVAGMPTAFVATWGSGKPVIAVLGEFDALPGLSQKDARKRSRSSMTRRDTAAATICWGALRRRRSWRSRFTMAAC
jgi:aminobenzoyl-glutamate utilization protein B